MSAVPDECPHGMGKPTACVLCMEDGPVTPPARWQKIGAPFSAGYDGVCAAGDRVTAGQTIQRWDRGDEATVYTHTRCEP